MTNRTARPPRTEQLGRVVRNLKHRAPWILLGGGIGAVLFVAVQNALLGGNITEYLGAQIVKRGGHSPGAAPYIGWGVHLAVSLSYAALAGLIVDWLPSVRARRYTSMAIGAVVLGWLTTLITSPAIAVTVSLLSGNGLPTSLPALNTSFGVPFWNHILFFAIAFAVFALSELRPGAKASATATATA